MKKPKPKPTKSGRTKRVAGLWYVNAAGRKVQDTTGRIKPSQLYYYQPDGSYERDGDRRTIGRIAPPAAKKPAPRKA